MKARILALVLALTMCLALCIPASALSADDFKRGRLSGVTTDGSTLLVTDTFNKVIWRVDGDKVTQYAGAIGVAGVNGEPIGVYHNGAIDKAYFMEPWAISPFLDGWAVSDSAANVIRYIANDRVMTLAGTGTAGATDGDAKNASFSRPTGLATDNEGRLYVADTGNGAIRRIAKDGKVTTVASGLTAPTGLCWYNGALYIAETGRSRICRLENGSIQTIAGESTPAEDSGEYYGGYSDGPAATARFDHPQGVAVGADGTVYVADTGNSSIRAIRDGRVHTVVRGSAAALMPISPRGMIVQGSSLRALDQFTGNIMTTSVADKVYTDVAANDWFADTVAKASRWGIASGTSATTFAPNATMNRAMFVTMLSRVYRLDNGSAIIDGDSSFSDVPANEWYGAPVRWAADKAIVRGESATFAPLRDISRQELVTMLYRYAQQQGMSAIFTDNALEAFPDAGEISDWALDAMRWACSHDILHGDDQGRLTPTAPATRAQALTMLLNFMNSYGL